MKPETIRHSQVTDFSHFMHLSLLKTKIKPIAQDFINVNSAHVRQIKDTLQIPPETL